MSFWLSVKSHGTNLAETFDIPNSLCRMFSTRSREMPTVLAIRFICKHKSYIITARECISIFMHHNTNLKIKHTGSINEY